MVAWPNISGAAFQTNGYKNNAFIGGYAAKTIDYNNNTDVYEITTFKKCARNSTTNNYKTSQLKVTITAINGRETSLPNRFSESVPLKCS